MNQLELGDQVAWNDGTQDIRGKVSRIFENDGGVLLDHGGPIPLQARMMEGQWFAYTGHNQFTIPVHRIESTP